MAVFDCCRIRSAIPLRTSGRRAVADMRPGRSRSGCRAARSEIGRPRSRLSSEDSGETLARKLTPLRARPRCRCNSGRVIEVGPESSRSPSWPDRGVKARNQGSRRRVCIIRLRGARVVHRVVRLADQQHAAVRLPWRRKYETSAYCEAPVLFGLALGGIDGGVAVGVVGDDAVVAVGLVKSGKAASSSSRRRRWCCPRRSCSKPARRRRSCRRSRPCRRSRSRSRSTSGRTSMPAG